MIALDLLVAVVLLTAPDLPEPAPVCRLDTLQAVAVGLELMDVRECRYVFARPEDFTVDLRLVRERYRDLADAPPVLDSLRFPSRDTLAGLIAFNWSYREWLRDRQRLCPQDAWEIGEVISECERLYEILDTARDAGCDYYYITVRRRALQKLRELIGAEAYYNGCLPPHVPVWRFQRIGE